MSRRDLPPLWYWGIPLVVAALRMLPAAWLRITEPPLGQSFLGVTYLPKDFLQYAAFSRQTAVDGAFFFYNPFTTEPQGKRFVLLFHWVIGLVARVTGISPIDAFEASRVPLLLFFFAALWWFLRPVFAEPRDRVAAALLVGFAGGLEGFVRPFAGFLPASAALRLAQDTSPLHGWSVFAAFFNPLWIASLGIALLVLRPFLFSAARSGRALAGAGAAFVVLFYVHPYTALGVLAIVAASWLAGLLSSEPVDWRLRVEDAAVLGLALATVGAVSLWQLEDPVYRRSTGGVLGPSNLSVLWYPLTLGVLGALAALGARRWLAARHPARAPILGWIAAVALLHWLPFVNGYKFVFLLPLPVSVLAAPVARDGLARARAAGRRGRALAALAGIAVFGGAALQTADALRSVRSVSAFPSDAMELVQSLAALPAGNALVPPGLGNVLPAFSAQRVWAGHWFLTPDYFTRERMYRRFTRDPAFAERLRAVVREQRIRYLVVPAERAGFVQEQLGRRVGERRAAGSFELLVLDGRHS